MAIPGSVVSALFLIVQDLTLSPRRFNPRMASSRDSATAREREEGERRFHMARRMNRNNAR